MKMLLIEDLDFAGRYTENAFYQCVEPYEKMQK